MGCPLLRAKGAKNISRLCVSVPPTRRFPEKVIHRHGSPNCTEGVEPLTPSHCRTARSPPRPSQSRLHHGHLAQSRHQPLQPAPHWRNGQSSVPAFLAALDEVKRSPPPHPSLKTRTVSCQKECCLKNSRSVPNGPLSKRLGATCTTSTHPGTPSKKTR
jgi:hypothetical protein